MVGHMLDLAAGTYERTNSEDIAKTLTSCPKLGIGSAHSKSHSKPLESGSWKRFTCGCCVDKKIWTTSQDTYVVEVG